MASDYTGARSFLETLSLMTDGDSPSAQLFRTPLERLLDNCAYLESQRLARDVFAVHPVSGVHPFSDLTQFMAAVSVPNSSVSGAAINGPGAMLLKSGSEDTKLLNTNDYAYYDPTGSVASITSAVREVAYGNGIFVAIGTGGNLNCHTANGGSWSAGGAGIGGAVEYLVYSPANALAGGGNQFLAAGSGTGGVFYSPDSATIWQEVGSNFPAVSGLAVLSNGYVVALGASGGKPRFSVLTDGVNGADFAGSVAPPNASTADGPGSLCGAPESPMGAAVYHAMICDSGARIRTASSADGTTWTAGATFELPFGGLGFTNPAGVRIMACKTTGLIVIAATYHPGSTVLYATRDFINWVGPGSAYGSEMTAFAVADGRLFAVKGDGSVYASSGVSGY